MIGRNEVLIRKDSEWLYFSNPHRVITTANAQDVYQALQEIEELVNTNNWHAAGFVSYEAAPAFDNALHVHNAGGFPLLWFGLYSKPQTYDLPKPQRNFSGLDWKPTTDRESYNTAIQKVKDTIAEGKTYQVNYTMRLRGNFTDNAWDFFLFLAQSQNKYAAYIDTGRYIICSASPELLFELDGETITGRPMKGTVHRGRTTQEDASLTEWLHNSIKNRAENVMIVDMIRNDLGRIAKTGSVHVPELFTVEKYPTLFQMTSIVQARTTKSVAEIFGALFPCASITGAPKVSTMDIIAELETTPRKIYTGSIGYISPNRKARFNVAIRTAAIDRETRSAEYGVGSGIVWDSTSADEYSEALLKARVLTERPQEFSLFETILWTPESEYFLCEKHIERMKDSACYFGFDFSEEKLELYLKTIAANFNSTQRVRILLDRSGQFTSEAQPFEWKKKDYKVCLAAQSVDSNNVFLYHKTTQREIYNNALIAPKTYNDVLLYNEKGELTEFTIGNLVIELDGKLITPPVSCGLLAGTFRAYLLETNQVKEQVIRKDQLKNCKKIFLVNSVRKWVEVEI